jgi:2'-5' RNA ligase
MTAPVLTRREGVELARTGVWATSTGVWTAEPDDFAAAVAATACPAVRRPYLRLGHTDGRFTPAGDGEPALGWIENLRLADSGHTLVGDYVGVPEWLDQVMASAYPDRSVEGKYSWRCQLGHTHPFVLTGLALLGVTPPGVGTLRPLESLDDVAGLFGVAAAGDDNGLAIAATIPGDVVRAHLQGKHDQDDHGRDRGAGDDGPSSGGGTSSGSTPSTAGAADKLKLAGRIKLGRGETLAGSDLMQTDDGLLLAAAIRTPDGPRLRLGLGIADEDRQRWSAANRGYTADLDAKTVGALRDVLGEMFETGQRAQSQYQELVAREKALKRRERELIRGQYKLTKAQGRELDRIDRRIGDLEQQIARLDRRRQERVDRLPPDVRARWEAAGPQEQDRIVGDWHAAQPEWRNVGIASFMREDAAKRKRLTGDLETARRTRQELTAGGGQMSPQDAAELKQVRRDLTDVDDAYADVETIEGEVSAEWANVSYEVYVEEDEPHYVIGANPHDETAVDRVALTPRQIRDLDEMLERLTVMASGVEVKAAAEVHAGAMVALIPASEDAERLAVSGGEPADQLHVTLDYLGDADQIPDRARQQVIGEVMRAIAGLPPLTVDAFAVSVFNPNNADRDTCIVLSLSGDGLTDAKALVGAAVMHAQTGPVGFVTPEEHTPFLPHVTLAYTDDLTKVVEWADRTGPVTFDRIRIAFGGEVTDLPLTGSPEDSGEVTPADLVPVAAAAGDAKLRSYWLAGEGAAKIRWGTPGDFTRCVRNLRGKVRDPEGLCNDYHFEANGFYPGDRRNLRAAKGDTMPNPQPDLPEKVRQAWNASRPFAQWIVRIDDGTVLACDEDAGRVFSRVPYVVDGDKITFGEPEPLDGVPVAAMSAEGGTVYASRTESRPGPAPEPPAAEPEPATITDPKEGDSVSTLSEDLRSRLGLTDADDAALLAAVDELKTKADIPPAPTPEEVAAAAAAEEKVAAAAAENADLRKEVSVLASQVQEMSTKLATAEAEKAATVKASVLDEAQKQGKFPPAARAQWEKDYDEAPGAVTRVLAAIAAGTAVPVTVAGEIGDAEPATADDAAWEREYASLFPPEPATTGKEN